MMKRADFSLPAREMTLHPPATFARMAHPETMLPYSVLFFSSEPNFESLFDQRYRVVKRSSEIRLANLAGYSRGQVLGMSSLRIFQYNQVRNNTYYLISKLDSCIRSKDVDSVI
jgi:hypothetical protein